jgi:hypothetical protein
MNVAFYPFVLSRGEFAGRLDAIWRTTSNSGPTGPLAEADKRAAFVWLWQRAHSSG